MNHSPIEPFRTVPLPIEASYATRGAYSSEHDGHHARMAAHAARVQGEMDASNGARLEMMAAEYRSEEATWRIRAELAEANGKRFVAVRARRQEKEFGERATAMERKVAEQSAERAAAEEKASAT
jgi:hypothetical protein